jgi:hypothetical protein
MTTVKASLLSLNSNAIYSYSAVIEGVSLVFRFTFNERANSWFMSVSEESGNSIVEGVRLTPNYPILDEFYSPFLSGYFLLVAKSETSSDEYLTKARYLDQYYDLYYIYST